MHKACATGFGISDDLVPSGDGQTGEPVEGAFHDGEVEAIRDQVLLLKLLLFPLSYYCARGLNGSFGVCMYSWVTYKCINLFKLCFCTMFVKK